MKFKTKKRIGKLILPLVVIIAMPICIAIELFYRLPKYILKSVEK